MARVPYYQDPVFLQKAAQRLPMGQTFSSPFSATQRNVSEALATRRKQAFGVQMQQSEADAARRAAVFSNSQAWKRWQGDVNRSATNIRAREQMGHQARLAALQREADRRSRRRSMLGGGVGALGTVGGALIGNMLLPGVGAVVGSQIGGAVGGAAGSQL